MLHFWWMTVWSTIFSQQGLQISCILPCWVCLAGHLICTRILNHQITKLKPSPRFPSIWLLYMSGCNWGVLLHFLTSAIYCMIGHHWGPFRCPHANQVQPWDSILFKALHYYEVILDGQLISIVLHFLHTLVPWLSTASCLFFQKMPSIPTLVGGWNSLLWCRHDLALDQGQI